MKWKLETENGNGTNNAPITDAMFFSRTPGQVVCLVINPRRACATRVTVVVLRVCVCVCACPFSLLCLLAPLGVQREVSAGTAWKMQ